MAEADAEMDDLQIGPDDLEEDLDLQEENPDEALDADLHLEEEPPQRQPSKAQKEIIKLRKRAQAAEDRASRAEELGFRTSGQVEALTRTLSAPSAEQRRAEEERLAAMTPEERIEFRIGQERNQFSSALAQQSFQTADTIDSMRFERLCEKNPVYDGVSEEVERRLEAMRKQGSTVDRKTLANNIIGEKTAAKALKKPAPQRQPPRPAGARSDVPPERNRGGKTKTAKERLEGKTF